MTDIRAILFDKDGTLVDFDRTWYAVAHDMALDAAGGDEAHAGHLLEKGGYDHASGRFRANSIIAAYTNAEIVDLWYPALGHEERRARIAEFDRTTAAEGARRAVAIEGLTETLAHLREKGFVLGVATNDSTEGAERTVEALGLSSFFAAVIGYDSVARPKPAADPLLRFCEIAGVEPSAVAMVGDNAHDLEMARAAGAGLAIGVLSGNGERHDLEALADVVLPSIAALPAWLDARE